MSYTYSPPPLAEATDGDAQTETSDGRFQLGKKSKKRSGRRIVAAATGITVTLVVVLGFAGYRAYETNKREEAQAAAQAAEEARAAAARAAAEEAKAAQLAAAQVEYDEFVDESEDVMDTLKELDLRTASGLNYTEHDELYDRLVTEFARLDVDGSTAESIEDDLERVVNLYGEANTAWNKYIYGPSSEESKRKAEQQLAWQKADSVWDEVQDELDAWKASLKSGELPESTLY